MTSHRTMEILVYGYDIHHDGNDYVLESTGDLRMAEGREAIFQWVDRAIATSPGEAQADPDYGAGLTEFIGGPSADVIKIMAAGNIKRELVKDDRIGKVKVEELETYTDELEDSYTHYHVILKTPINDSLGAPN